MSITLAEMLDNLFGVKSTHRINVEADEINSTVTQILKANPNRLSVLVINLGAQAVFLTPDNSPSSTRGIYLAPNGGSMILMFDKDFQLPASEWWGICSVDNNDVLIMENVSI